MSTPSKSPSSSSKSRGTPLSQPRIPQSPQSSTKSDGGNASGKSGSTPRQCSNTGTPVTRPLSATSPSGYSSAAATASFVAGPPSPTSRLASSGLPPSPSPRTPTSTAIEGNPVTPVSSSKQSSAVKASPSQKQPSPSSSPRDRSLNNTSSPAVSSLAPTATTPTSAAPPTSTSSQKMIQQLNSLDSQFDDMTRRVAKLDSIIDPNDPRTLVLARDELNSIVTSLREMLENSGEDHPMAAEIADLLRHSHMLQGHIERAIKTTLSRGVDLGLRSPTATAATTAAAASEEPESEEDSENNEPLEGSPPDLRRDEIGKLLLLVARAYKTQNINVRQRALIKGHICRRAGYLRIILEQSDMKIVMGALSAIGNDDDEDNDGDDDDGDQEP